MNQYRDARSVLHSAFTFVRSVEANQATSAVTLDNVINRQITLLKKGEKRSIVDAAGESVGDRLSRFDRLQSLKEDLDAVIQAIGQADASADPEAALNSLGVFEALTETGA